MYYLLPTSQVLLLYVWRSKVAAQLPCAADMSGTWLIQSSDYLVYAWWTVLCESCCCQFKSAIIVESWKPNQAAHSHCLTRLSRNVPLTKHCFYRVLSVSPSLIHTSSSSSSINAEQSLCLLSVKLHVSQQVYFYAYQHACDQLRLWADLPFVAAL